MDEQNYENWWPLYVCASRGESLTPEERASYETMLKQLHVDERFAGEISELQKKKKELARQEEVFSRLHSERQRRSKEIASLENALSVPIRNLLGVEA